MVSVAPLLTVTFPVTRYGPPPDVHVTLAAIAPLLVPTLASSYQTSTNERSISLLDPSNDCTRTRLIPGLRLATLALFVKDHVAPYADHTASAPLTLTDRVSIACAEPARTAEDRSAVVTLGYPPDTAGVVPIVRSSGIWASAPWTRVMASSSAVSIAARGR